MNHRDQSCDRDPVDLGLLSNISETWTTSGEINGADRLHRQLGRDGIRVGPQRVGPDTETVAEV